MKLYAFLPWILQVIAWPFAHIILRVRGKLKISGIENLTKIKGPVIIVSNHVNDVDPVLQRAIHPFISKPLFWVGRSRKFYNENADEPFVGWRGLLYGDWFFRSWGSYPAYRGSGDYEKSLVHHIKLLESGFRVGMFPQGGKAKLEGRNAPVHGGAAFLAQRTATPLVPVALGGTLHFNIKKLLFGKVKIDIFILPPVLIEKGIVTYKEKTEEVMSLIWDTLERSGT